MQSELEHTITDDSGYRVRTSDVAFLGISSEALDNFVARVHPLGVTREEYERFKTSLENALKRDEIVNVDVRLQGSSAHFFSGPHKFMPFEPGDIANLFMEVRDRTPDKAELDRILRDVEQLWPREAKRPVRRLFDSLHRLGIERFPSDLDVQISSDEIVDRAQQVLRRLGIPEDQITVDNHKYAFVKKALAAEVCPHLTSWAIRQSDVLPRPVTVAIFPSSGPPISRDSLSSHFRETDWLVQLGGGGE